MKTLEDLVKKLNETDEGEGYYKLSEYPEGTFRVCYKLANQEWSITAFGKSSKKISLASNGHIMNWQEMYWISKYALEHSYEDWFDEDIIEVDGIKLTRGQAEKVYQKLTSERLYNNK